ncbi:Threonylcarbamoyladenosine tRNA methylthiotransferase, partial [Takifugu flavidus]
SVRVETVQSAWVFGHCAWVRVWSGGYEGQQPRADSSPPRFRARKAQEQQKKVVVAGCVPQAQPRMDYLKGLSIIGVQQIDRVVEVVDEAVKVHPHSAFSQSIQRAKSRPTTYETCDTGHSVRLLGQKKDGGRRLGGARLDLPKIRKNPLIEIISINTGCLNACTYCKTKHARGDLASYPIEELVERTRQSFQGQ